jgi:hypothetical protein
MGLLIKKYFAALLRSNLAVQPTSLSCQFVAKKSSRVAERAGVAKFTFARKKIWTYFVTQLKSDLNLQQGVTIGRFLGQNFY